MKRQRRRTRPTKTKQKNKTKQIRTLAENKRKFVRISHCQISEEGLRRPFPDDRMPSEVPRKSLPRKRSFLRGNAHLRKQAASQPASQPASAHHTSKLQKQSYAVCAQGQGSFFKKKRQKKFQVKKQTPLMLNL
jgi:hypothetical protein